MPIQWPRPKLASVDDIPSWEHAAPTLAVSFGRLQEEKWLKAWPGGDLDAKDEEGWSALQRAAAEGLAVAVKELLRRPGVEVNGVEPARGQTALFLASRLGHEAVVRALLACAEVEVNQAADDSYTALLIAAELGHEAVVQLLLAHAAVDPNQAVQNGATPLFIAALKGHDAVVRLLLAHEAVDANQARQDGVTPLIIAAQNGRDAVVRLLLAHAAIEPNQAKEDGCTPLYIAAMVNKEAIVRLLLAHPAVDAERAHPSGATPLLIASMNRSTAAALALLEAKADPNARDNYGDSPLVVARRGDNAQLLAALVAAGADVAALYPPLVAKCMLGLCGCLQHTLLGARRRHGGRIQEHV